MPLKSVFLPNYLHFIHDKEQVEEVDPCFSMSIFLCDNRYAKCVMKLSIRTNVVWLFSGGFIYILKIGRLNILIHYVLLFVVDVGNFGPDSKWQLNDSFSFCLPFLLGNV